MAKYNLCNVSELSDEHHIAIALKGNWYKNGSGFARVTILKDLLFVTSGIATRTETLNIELPTSNKFLLLVNSASGSRCVVVEKKIDLTLNEGEQIFGICNL